MTEADDSAAEEVRLRLRAAGLSLSDEELSGATKLYRFYRAGVRLLYEVPEARYAEPVSLFRADPGPRTE